MSGSASKKRTIVEVVVPWYQARDRNRYEDDEENLTEDEGDDKNDEDYFYYQEEEEEEEEEGEGSKNARKRIEKGKKKQKADWEQEDEEEQEEEQRHLKQKNKPILSSHIPNFEPIKRRGIRDAQVQLDHIENSSFASIFTQFFNKAMLDTIIENTNAYALSKDAGQGRPWINLVRKELLIFLAILIYLGLYPQNGIEELWNNDPSGPIHQIAKEMTLKRFQQIKRYLHISKLQDNNNPYYAKVEPLLSHVRETSKKLYIPSLNVSVDEMMVWFSGHSIHTVRIRGRRLQDFCSL